MYTSCLADLRRILHIYCIPPALFRKREKAKLFFKQIHYLQTCYWTCVILAQSPGNAFKVSRSHFVNPLVSWKIDFEMHAGVPFRS